MAKFANLTAGDPGPYFRQRSFSNPTYNFHAAGGRYIVLCFYGSAEDPHSRAAIDGAMKLRDVFNDSFASFFGVSTDRRDESEKRVQDDFPGYRYFWDFDKTICKLYGVAAVDDEDDSIQLERRWIVLDPTLRIQKIIPFKPDQSDIGELKSYMNALPPADQFAGLEVSAPVLVLPNVFEPDFCSMLIEQYESNGGLESGFMREKDGKTVLVHDHAHKRRRDFNIADNDLITTLRNKFLRRVVPEIMKVHCFKVTRMERYMVACYRAEDGAHFRAHRDNTTRGTAHRRFAVSINLNDDFEGGRLNFPEYGQRTYKAPAGTAVVFSCSLLHAVAPITAGKRYTFLPFLYDDAAAAVREENNKFLGDGIGKYNTNPTPPN